jgi:hypothetical protein
LPTHTVIGLTIEVGQYEEDAKYIGGVLQDLVTMVDISGMVETYDKISNGIFT